MHKADAILAAVLRIDGDLEDHIVNTLLSFEVDPAKVPQQTRQYDLLETLLNASLKPKDQRKWSTNIYAHPSMVQQELSPELAACFPKTRPYYTGGPVLDRLLAAVVGTNQSELRV